MSVFDMCVIDLQRSATYHLTYSLEVHCLGANMVMSLIAAIGHQNVFQAFSGLSNSHERESLFQQSISGIYIALKNFLRIYSKKDC